MSIRYIGHFIWSIIYTIVNLMINNDLRLFNVHHKWWSISISIYIYIYIYILHHITICQCMFVYVSKNVLIHPNNPIVIIHYLWYMSQKILWLSTEQLQQILRKHVMSWRNLYPPDCVNSGRMLSSSCWSISSWHCRFPLTNGIVLGPLVGWKKPIQVIDNDM